MAAAVLTVAARELLSFQIDGTRMKSLAHAWLTSVASEAGLDPALKPKLETIADRTVDTFAPVAMEIKKALAEVDRASSAGAKGHALEGPVTELFKALVSAIDAKDRMVTEIGRTLSAGERAGLIVKTARHVRSRMGVGPETVEPLIDSLRAARHARVVALLGLSGERSKALKTEMDALAASRKGIRESRRELVARMERAVGGKGGEGALAALLVEWDKLQAKGSDLVRTRFEHAKKLLTTEEIATLAHTANERLERAGRLLALIGRFAPVR
jgi:hypothetical protein